MKKFIPLFLFAAVLFLPQSAYAGLSEGCFPIVQCNSGEDFFANACQLHIETLTGAVDSCQSINGAPAAGKSWAFSCDAGCYQKGGGGGTVNPCPGGVMVSGQCLITLDVVDDDVPVTGVVGYKIWDGTDLTHIPHIGTAGCAADDYVPVWDSSSPTNWSCVSTSTLPGLWSTDGTNVWRPSGFVGIQQPTPGASLDIYSWGFPAMEIGNANATGIRSIAWGTTSLASGEDSFSSGVQTTASGSRSVAMNAYGTASGAGSASFNYSTTAAGHYSSSFGLGTISWNPYSMAVGRYNDTSKPIYNNNYFNSNPEDLLFMVGVGGSNLTRENALVVTSGGRVGIGTNGPQAALHIRQDGSPEPAVYIDTTTNIENAGIRLRDNGTNRWHILNASSSNSDALEFRAGASATPSLIVEQGGDVGIGTLNPTAKFHVIGPNSVNSTFGAGGIGVTATGNGGGALLADANSNAIVAIANDSIGITALGDSSGGYFADSNSTGYAFVGIGDIGITSHGSYAGGYFNDTNATDEDVYLAWGGYSMLANGPISIAESGSPAIYVANEEALWYDGSTFSWGYGGEMNVFDDRVVIGTTSPISSYDLEVAGSALIYGQGYFNGNVYVNDSTWPGNGYLQVKGGSGYGAYFQLFEEVGSTNYGWYFKNDGAANKLYLATYWPGSGYHNVIRETREYDGTLCIGCTGSSYLFRVNGSAYSNGSWVTSDARLKKNVETLDSSLEKVAALRGVSFDWRHEEFPEYNFDHGHQLGLIAQEVEKVVPEVIAVEEEDGFKAVEYGKLVPVLIEAIKELRIEKDAEIEELRSVVCELKPDADICG